MNGRKLFLSMVLVAGGVTMGVALADQGKDAPAGMPQMKLPEGWTQEDMQSCMAAGMPGKMHELLMKDAGTWKGKNTMWMGPGMDPVSSESTTTLTPVLGGRYLKGEISGQMPGMGPYNAIATFGFDNVSQKFVYTWIDNMGTGIANGTGDLSPDGKVLTWDITFNCPITKKVQKMREVDTVTGPNTKRIEMFGTDPKSGKEFKMMNLELTRQG